MLYFQRTFEALKIDSLRYSLESYNLYWDSFLSLLKFDEGVEEVLKSIRVNRKICLVTDLTVHIQHRKVEKLHLYQYLDFMVSSEEAGKEKPDPVIFNLALNKLNLKPDEVCMIGDNYKKDNMGASNLGIRSFWINRDGEKYPQSDLIKELKSFNELIHYV
jgi:putative hydrolase of the HAD superfamily